MKHADLAPMSPEWEQKYAGTPYEALTIPQAVKLTGMSHATLYLRMVRSGLTLDQAMYWRSNRQGKGQPLNPAHNYDHPFDMFAASLKSGVPAAVIHNRVHILGWDHERAANEPLWDKRPQRKVAP